MLDGSTEKQNSPIIEKSLYELELERLVEKWVKILRITSWDYEIKIGGEFENKSPEAEVVIDDEDSAFTIRFSALASLETKKLEALVVHELSHVVIHRVLPEVQSKANLREEERLVNNLVKIFCKLEGK